MDNVISFITKKQISKDTVLVIAKIINKTVNRKLIGSDKSLPVGKIRKENSDYIIDYSISGNISSSEVSSISAAIASVYDGYVLEFDDTVIDSSESDIKEDYDINTEWNLYDTDPYQHARWIEKKNKEGWSYGLTFNEQSKTNPYMRPYHMLSDEDKDLFKKSKNLLGYYGLAYSYMVGDDDNTSDSGSLDIINYDSGGE